VLVEAMRETEEVASKRRAFREMAELLHRASEIVNEVSCHVCRSIILNYLHFELFAGAGLPTNCLDQMMTLVLVMYINTSICI
jgi:hypothetical protein